MQTPGKEKRKEGREEIKGLCSPTVSLS